MQGEAVLRHLGALAQARAHHPPADDRLEREQARRDGDLAPERALELAAHPEPERRQDERRADDARQQAMSPFPPEDGLEAFDRHVGVEPGELRDLPVAIEFRLPVGGAERRNDPGHRLPLGDRKAQFGQAGRPADDNHGEDERRHDEEPGPHARAGADAQRRSACARKVDRGHGIRCIQKGFPGLSGASPNARNPALVLDA